MKKELKTKGYKARPSKAKLKDIITELRGEIFTLQSNSLKDVRRIVALKKENLRLQLLEQEQLTIIYFLRSNVLRLGAESPPQPKLQ